MADTVFLCFGSAGQSKGATSGRDEADVEVQAQMRGLDVTPHAMTSGGLEDERCTAPRLFSRARAIS